MARNIEQQLQSSDPTIYAVLRHKKVIGKWLIAGFLEDDEHGLIYAYSIGMGPDEWSYYPLSFFTNQDGSADSRLFKDESFLESKYSELI